MTAGIIREESGTHFDPVVAAAFLRQQGGRKAAEEKLPCTGNGDSTAWQRRQDIYNNM